ncbi:unnamed protein product [Moneuplotes crassus]|uniref:Uncharacterized protein n=1 Tax=Euplotes crassus TaxID=5936 RepID=A0AAD1U9Q0_EUPCR|nr:unnamed protein product [Moneuplotes crassus]
MPSLCLMNNSHRLSSRYGVLWKNQASKSSPIQKLVVKRKCFIKGAVQEW